MISLLDPAFVASVAAPPALSPPAGMSLWLKASSLALADNDPVATWPDLSGNGNDATQSTSGARPLFRTAILNGKPVVRFDGVDDLLSLTNSLTSRTVIAVATYTAGSTPFLQPIFEESADTDNAFRANVGAPEFRQPALGGDFYVNGLATRVFSIVGAPLIATLIYNSDAGNLRKLGGGAFFWTGDFAEILIYPTALSAPDREAAEAYLADEYGITL